MSQSIEKELHGILLDLAHDIHDYDEQAEIVAEAAELYRRIEASCPRIASRKNEDKIREAQLMDSLLQAMGRLDDWNDTESITNYVDGRGLEPDQIVHRAETMKPKRIACEGLGKHMDIINDVDLDVFLEDEDGEDDSHEEWLDDLVHDPEIYRIPGTGFHRSDSQVR